MDECVACGERFEGENHHCNPKREERIEAQRKRIDLGVRKPGYVERLAFGFALLRDNSQPI